MSYLAGVSAGLGGLEIQNFIHCDSGINLFVNLQIESTESSYNCLGNKPKVLCEDSEGPSRDYGEPSSAKVSPGELGEDLLVHFGEVTRQESRYMVQNETSGERIRQLEQSGQVEEWRPVPDVVPTRFLPSFVAPAEGQRVGEPQCLNYLSRTKLATHEWNDHPDERFSGHDHENLCDQESLEETLCRQSGYGIPSQANIVGRFHDLIVNWKTDLLQDVCHEDPEDQYKERSSADAKQYFCHENRSWSPQVEDYSSVVPMNVNRDPDNQHVTGCSDDSSCLGGRLDEDCAGLPSSSISSEKKNVGRLLLDHCASPNLEISLRKSPEIENFDGAQILAARTILQISGNHRKDLVERELSTGSGYDVHNLGFRDRTSKEGNRLAKMVEKVYATLPDADVQTTSYPVQSGSGQMELLWGDDGRYIPTIVRAKGRPRGSKFSTRIGFGISEFEEENDCEVLQRSSKKRRYKSTQELLQA